MNDVIQKIYDIGIVPVIAIDDADKAVPLAKALVKGGLPAAEVTFRTAAAEEAIKRIVAEVPEMLVGAGTVLTKEQADRAIAAGVKFIVSPGFNPEITKYVIDKGMLMMPGTATPGEMEQAMSMGLDVVKFFPAEQNGGVAKLKAVAGPYTNLRWMPTGGVNAKNLLDYLSFNKIIACGGTWMVKKDLIEAENWDEIERLTREAVNTMLGFEVKHIGINTENAEEAMKAAKLFELMFGFDVSEGNSSIFCGSRAIEIMKKQYLGKNGHIAIGTNTLPRAIAYFKSRGFEFNEDRMGGDIFLPGSQPFLHVNVNGERFMNEDQCYPMSYAAGANQPKHYSWIVWDGNYWDDIAQFDTCGCSRLYPAPSGTAFNADVYDCEAMSKEHLDEFWLNPRLEAGTLKKADTLEALADMMEFDADQKATFLATVERYNGLVAAGEDTDFGKPAYRLSDVETAPFFAARIGGELLVTIHGVITDVNSQPLKNDGTPIEGLYVCGNDQGGFYPHNYPSNFTGINAGRTATFARIAAKHALGVE